MPLAIEQKLPVFVAGDSHAKIFLDPRMQMEFPSVSFESGAIAGATISGYANPNSKTQAFPIIWSRLAKSRAKLVITLFGEIDMGFVVWFHAQKYGQSVQLMLEKALVNYRVFLDRLAQDERSILCISAPLPTIPDGEIHGDVANARNNIEATQKERTRLTLQFNLAMQEYCLNRGYGYLMLDAVSLGATGLIKTELVNSDINDHHYESLAYVHLLSQQIRALAEQNAVIGSCLGLNLESRIVDKYDF